VNRASRWAGLALVAPMAPLAASPAIAESASVRDLAAQLARAKQEIAQQQALLDARATQIITIEARLAAIEARLAQSGNSPASAQPRTAAVDAVGQRPDEPLEADALPAQGAERLTRKGRLVAEWSLDYTQANRSRALFRGDSLLGGVLIGSFDINESRTNLVTGALGLRYGLSNRLEIAGRLPVVWRSDTSALTPLRVSGSTATIDNSVNAFALGDGQLSARYQLNVPRYGGAYMVANGHVELPTGRGPFSVRRDADGLPLEGATGAGTWGLGGGLTGILPSDPGVLFASIDYLKNFATSVDTLVSSSRIVRVNPGDSISFGAGMGLSLNDRTSINLGYTHSWIFPAHITSLDANGARSIQSTEALQQGRLQFGLSYRVNRSTSVNWSVEVGATRDAPDVRTSLRVPMVLLGGGG